MENATSGIEWDDVGCYQHAIRWKSVDGKISGWGEIESGPETRNSLTPSSDADSAELHRYTRLKTMLGACRSREFNGETTVSYFGGMLSGRLGKQIPTFKGTEKESEAFGPSCINVESPGSLERELGASRCSKKKLWIFGYQETGARIYGFSGQKLGFHAFCEGKDNAASQENRHIIEEEKRIENNAKELTGCQCECTDPGTKLLTHSALTFVKGGTAGLLSAALLQPLDVVKTRIQGLDKSCREAKPVKVREAVNDIWRRDGVFGFWRAIEPTLARAFLGPGIYFVVLSSLQYPSDNKEDVKFHVFLEGAAARGIAGTALCPLSVVKTRMEWIRAASNTSPSSVAMLQSIAKYEGIRGLFRGNVPTLVRDIPSSGLYLVLYQSFFQPWSRKLFGDSVSTPLLNFCSGTISGVISALITHPTDSLKTYMQLNKSPILKSCKELYIARGVQGYFSGLSLRILRRPLTMAIIWTTYELLGDLSGQI